jgi:hypothetical protein
VWLIVLSDQLPIIALVGHYPANQLIGRRPLLKHSRLSLLRFPALQAYTVLATVSGGYPPLQGRSSTCYSPVCHFPQTEAWFTFDLHVLSTPPAFILSQDQTLRKVRLSKQAILTSGYAQGCFTANSTGSL